MYNFCDLRTSRDEKDFYYYYLYKIVIHLYKTVIKNLSIHLMRYSKKIYFIIIVIIIFKLASFK